MRLELEKTLSTSQVARRLRVSPARVAQLREEGKLTGHRTPLGFLYDPEEVLRLEKARSVGEVSDR